jgi:putative transposase
MGTSGNRGGRLEVLAIDLELEQKMKAVIKNINFFAYITP